MKIKASTDGIGKTLEIRRDPDETDADEVRHLARLIAFLMSTLEKKL